MFAPVIWFVVSSSPFSRGDRLCRRRRISIRMIEPKTSIAAPPTPVEIPAMVVVDNDRAVVEVVGRAGLAEDVLLADAGDGIVGTPSNSPDDDDVDVVLCEV